MNNFIKLTNFNNDLANQVASYMIMEDDANNSKLKVNSYEYQDIIHNSIYYLDREGYLNNTTLVNAIDQACSESGIRLGSLNQDLIDKIVNDVLKEYRGY